MKKMDFLWAGGIENTFINDPFPATGKRLDEYELIDHYGKWQNDVKSFGALSLNSMRWGIPWYRVNPEKGVFDLSWPDQVVDAFLEQGISPIIDLVHYGTPDWIDGAFLHPDYPRYVTDYTSAVIEKLGDRITYITPNNEPYTACEFCGLKKEWPPYGQSYSIFTKIMKQICRGVIHSSRLATEAGLINIHAEVASQGWTNDSSLQHEADWFTALQSLYWDIITGRVTRDHHLNPWLMKYGWTESDQEYFMDNSITIDVMGLNFYPQWSVSELVKAPENRLGENWKRKRTPVGKEKLKEVLRSYWDKYHVPLMITETSVYGSSEEKSQWLMDSVEAVTELKREGLHMVGYTWFPLIDMIDWNYRVEEGRKEDFLMNLGLLTIDRKPYDAMKTMLQVIENSEL
jgi:beta-glucosidase/6-phospho-beta-glucosidase/beta-galactosidase